MRNIQLLTFLAPIFVLVLYYAQPGLLEVFESRTYDLRVRALRTGAAPSPRIAIVAIDDRSIAELGRFPWSREQFSAFLRRTAEGGAKAVLFDVIFPERETAAADAGFARAVRAPGTTTLAAAFNFNASGGAIGCTTNIPELQQAAAHIAHMNVLPDEDGVIRWTPLAIPWQGKTYPSLGLQGAAELL
ncbi:MAG TPA: CHASE2 domain-containing protein, partial [Geobacteraceae bacterium]